MAIEMIILIAAVAFFFEFLDASAGAGYGSSAAVLIALGFLPLEAVPAVLLTGIVFNIIASAAHHKMGNADFSLDGKELKIATMLGFAGVLGVIGGVILLIFLPVFWTKIYIAVSVILVGTGVLLNIGFGKNFSWIKISILGFAASLNKGLSGGNFGQILTGGQILSGIKSKRAVPITIFTDGLISILAVVILLLVMGLTVFNTSLLLPLLTGGALATPFAAHLVNKISPKILRGLVGIVSIVSGIVILLEIFIPMLPML